MKIEIEFNSSYEADIVIDGRKMTYGYKDGFWKFLSGLSIEKDEHDTTIGGIIALKIAEQLPDILQGWMPEENQFRPDGEEWETWDKLSEEAADEVYERVRP